MRRKILVVEDSEEMRFLYRRLFRKVDDVEIADVERAEHAWELMPRYLPDLVIVDISLPGMSGLDLTRMIHEHFPSVKIIIVTGHEVERYRDDAMRAGADDLVPKTIGKELVRRCLELMGGCLETTGKPA